MAFENGRTNVPLACKISAVNQGSILLARGEARRLSQLEL